MPPPPRHPRPQAEAEAEAEAAVLAEVRAIYAELERRQASAALPGRHCAFATRCCRFRLTGLTPRLTLGEARLAAQGVRAAGWKALPETNGKRGDKAGGQDGACPLLHPQTGRCRIYAQRPFGCRTHFCDTAGGNLPRAAVLDLIRRLEAVADRLGAGKTAVEPRPLAAAVADALAQWG